MALSSHRLLIWIVAVNLLMATGLEIYQNPDASEAEVIDFFTTEYTTLAQQGAIVSNPDVHNPNSESQLTDPSWGNAVRMGAVLVRIFTRGLLPFPLTSGVFTSVVESMVGLMLNVFKAYIYLIIIIELYLILKNRKSS